MLLKKYLLRYLAASMRSPSGLSGWMARKLMESANPMSTVHMLDRLQLSSTDEIFVELGGGGGAGLKHILAISNEAKETDSGDASSSCPQRIVSVEISSDFRHGLEKIKKAYYDQESLPPYPDSIDIVPNDCKDLPMFRDSSVDKIAAMNVVYFLDPLPVYLSELHRILKPDGILSFGCKFYAVPQDKPDIFVNIDQDKIVQSMEDAGFEVTGTYVKVGEGKPKDFVELLGRKK